MPICATTIENTRNIVGLLPMMDLRAARPLNDTLSDAMTIGTPLTIEASSVERISTACIQILIAFMIAAREAGIGVTLSRPSQPFVSAFEDLGLQPLLAQWQVEA